MCREHTIRDAFMHCIWKQCYAALCNIPCSRCDFINKNQQHTFDVTERNRKKVSNNRNAIINGDNNAE